MFESTYEVGYLLYMLLLHMQRGKVVGYFLYMLSCFICFQSVVGDAYSADVDADIIDWKVMVV